MFQHSGKKCLKCHLCFELADDEFVGPLCWDYCWDLLSTLTKNIQIQRLYTEIFILNLTKSTRNQIVFTIFRLISAWFNKISLCVEKNVWNVTCVLSWRMMSLLGPSCCVLSSIVWVSFSRALDLRSSFFSLGGGFVIDWWLFLGTRWFIINYLIFSLFLTTVLAVPCQVHY